MSKTVRNSMLVDDVEAISSFIECLADRVKANVTVVDSSSLAYPHMLHLTPEKKPIYVPRIGVRQHLSEDRTTPRVTVADTLIGCFIGYAAFYNQFIESTAYVNNKKTPFNNGLYLRKIPFKYAIKPNNKLVYDQSVTNEHWLVNYSPETAEYASEEIGVLFLSEMTFTARSGASPSVFSSFFLHVEEEINLSSSVTVGPGYYSLTLERSENLTFNSKRLVSVVEISKEAFMERKVIAADKLSADQTAVPIYSAIPLSPLLLPSYRAFGVVAETESHWVNTATMENIAARADGDLCYVAVSQDGIIGHMTLKAESTLTITDIRVLKDYRRTGVGSKFLKLAKAVAEEKQYPEIHVTVEATDTGMKRLLDKEGFILRAVDSSYELFSFGSQPSNPRSPFQDW